MLILFSGHSTKGINVLLKLAYSWKQHLLYFLNTVLHYPITFHCFSFSLHFPVSFISSVQKFSSDIMLALLKTKLLSGPFISTKALLQNSIFRIINRFVFLSVIFFSFSDNVLVCSRLSCCPAHLSLKASEPAKQIETPIFLLKHQTPFQILLVSVG